MKLLRVLLALLPAACTHTIMAEEPEVIYDEAKVPPYTLPDALAFEDGSPVRTPEDWKRRRAELLDLFSREVYGNTPVGKPAEMRFEKRKTGVPFLDGKAVLEEIRIHFSEKEDAPALDLLVIKPAAVSRAVPAVLAINFAGNHSIHPSTVISLNTNWMRSSKEEGEKGFVVEFQGEGVLSEIDIERKSSYLRELKIA